MLATTGLAVRPLFTVDGNEIMILKTTVVNDRVHEWSLGFYNIILL